MYKVAHYSLYIFFLSNCQNMWLLYNVITFPSLSSYPPVSPVCPALHDYHTASS